MVVSVLLFMLILWVLRPIHYAITGVLGLVLVSILGLGRLATVAEGFSSDPMFFLSAMLLVGYAVHTTGLGQNIALSMIGLCKGKPGRIILATPFIVMSMAVLVPSAIARAVILKGIYKEISSRSFHVEKNRQNFLKATMLAVGPLNPAASVTFLSGSAAPLIAAEIISNFTGIRISWLSWFALIGIPYVALFTLLTIYLYFRYPLERETTSQNHEVLPVTRLSMKEMKLLAVVCSMILAWLFGNQLNIPAVIPALLGVFALFLPGIDILKVKDIRCINWELLVFNGVAISFSYLLVSSGAARWVSDIIYQAFAPFNLHHIFLTIVLILILVLLRMLFFNNAPYLTSVLPVIFMVAPRFNLNSVYLSFITVLASSIVFIPMQSLAAMIAIDGDAFSKKDIASFGMTMIMCYAVIIPLSMIFLWPLLVN